MDEPEKQVTELLSNSLEIDAPFSPDRFREILTQRIAWLIDNRIEFLFQALYRMDVDEQKVHAVLPGAHAAEKLADLFIERAKQKLKWRSSGS